VQMAMKGRPPPCAGGALAYWISGDLDRLAEYGYQVGGHPLLRDALPNDVALLHSVWLVEEDREHQADLVGLHGPAWGAASSR